MYSSVEMQQRELEEHVKLHRNAVKRRQTCGPRVRLTVVRACRQRGRQTVYQRRSGDRLFGAGDHIGLVVDLEGQSGQTGRQRDRRDSNSDKA